MYFNDFGDRSSTTILWAAGSSGRSQDLNGTHPCTLRGIWHPTSFDENPNTSDVDEQIHQSNGLSVDCIGNSVDHGAFFFTFK